MLPEGRPAGVVVVSALVALTAGCPAPPPQSQFPTADDALARMHASYDCGIGVQGTAKIDLVTKKGRVKTDADLFAVSPESVRFDVLTPVMPTLLYTLTSDGKDFKFADHEQNIFSYGAASQCALSRFTQVPVPPHALVALLRGEAPVLIHGKEQAKISWDGGHYLLELGSKHDAKQEIHLEVHPDDFNKPWAEQRVRVTHVGVSQGGWELYRADLTNHRAGKTAPARVDEDGIDDPVPPSGPECAAELPYTIRFRIPDTKDDVVFDYKNAAWNPPLLPETFTQPVPGGMRKDLVDCK